MHSLQARRKEDINASALHRTGVIFVLALNESHDRSPFSAKKTALLAEMVLYLRLALFHELLCTTYKKEEMVEYANAGRVGPKE